jgi:hypothetical protein
MLQDKVIGIYCLFGKRPDMPYQDFIKETNEKRIEKSITEIVEMTQHSICAVKAMGFFLKILLSFCLST